jgi:hypothetical protein
LKKSNRKKKPITIVKKPTGSVQFWFYKPKTKKTKPNPNQEKTRAKPGKNRAKTEKTKPNRFEQVFVLKNRTETGRFEPVSVFLISVWLFFFIKTKSNRK